MFPKSKKGIAPMVAAALITLIPFFLIVFLGGTATIKWLTMDKTPIILGAILVLLLVMKQRRQ